jgi:hypothetical protein
VPQRGGARAAGVHWDSSHKKWIAKINAIAGDGKSKSRKLGSFVSQVDAALAYDQAAREHHKDKAQLNFPDLPPQLQVVWRKAPRGATSQYRGKGRSKWGLACLPYAVFNQALILLMPVKL